MNQQKVLSLEEIEALLKIDPAAAQDYLQRRQNERLKVVAENLRDEAPLISDLQRAGVRVSSVDDFLKRNCPLYPKAIPMLLMHLSKSHLPDIRGAIARALTCDEARSADRRPIVQAFLEESDKSLNGPKWELANALAFLATQDDAAQLIDWATNKDFGPAREPFVRKLGRMKTPSVQAVLTTLMDDPDVGGFARRALRR